MNEKLKALIEQATTRSMGYAGISGYPIVTFDKERFAELILANADELNRMTNTDPINKPFELDPKFVANCDEAGRSRRHFQ